MMPALIKAYADRFMPFEAEAGQEISRRPSASGLPLLPEQGVEITADGKLFAVSSPAWLAFADPGPFRQMRWFRIRYSSSFFDAPVRPLIRFTTASGQKIQFAMNGAVLGTGEWIGRVPKNTVAVAVSPNDCIGPVHFRVDSVESISRPALLARATLSNPSWTYEATKSRLVRSRALAWHQLKFASSTPLSRYQAWHDNLARDLELDDLDKPRFDWNEGPDFLITADLTTATADELRATVRSLQGQCYTGWTLQTRVSSDARPASVAALQELARQDPRIVEVSPDFPQDSAWLAAISFGDTLAPYAFGAVAEQIVARPEAVLVYPDEDAVSPNGRLHSPRLKPDWSPALNAVAPFVGRFAFMRVDAVAAMVEGGVAQFIERGAETISAMLNQSSASSIIHLQRVIYRSAGVSGVPQPRKATLSMDAGFGEEWPGVSIVVPTRDRAELLKECLQGLRENTDYPNFEVAIVDNGTLQPEALALMDEARADPRFKILRRPGAFNHSHLSNEGARATTKPILVFMNNDIVMTDPGWLKALVRVAAQPKAGVTGAKLLLPDGRIQHASLVLGLGGIAGHIYYGKSDWDTGYMSQLKAEREVSAVTAACCAVARHKFDAVGGFDEALFPIELNDIDFCMRIAEKDWINMWTPEAVLVHAQSASRGKSEKPSSRYERERKLFEERWRKWIRNDPFFHPAFSLYARHPALG